MLMSTRQVCFGCHVGSKLGSWHVHFKPCRQSDDSNRGTIRLARANPNLWQFSIKSCCLSQSQRLSAFRSLFSRCLGKTSLNCCSSIHTSAASRLRKFKGFQTQTCRFIAGLEFAPCGVKKCIKRLALSLTLNYRTLFLKTFRTSIVRKVGPLRCPG